MEEANITEENVNCKICTGCKKELSVTNFYIRKDSKKYVPKCKKCYIKKATEYAYENYKKVLEYHKKWRSENRDKDSSYKQKWLKNNKELRKQIVSIWKKENKKAVTADSNKRRALKLKATPKWADLEAIKQFYLNCPEGYEVDHIIPLKGKTVCGFHILENLQYLIASENSKKLNKFDGTLENKSWKQSL